MTSKTQPPMSTRARIGLILLFSVAAAMWVGVAVKYGWL